MDDKQRKMALREWAHGLAGLSGDEIATGLKALDRRDNDFPPSLGAFRSLCQPGGQRPQYFKSLGRPKANAGLVSREIAKQVAAIISPGRRSIYSPGYGPAEYQSDLVEARAAGHRLYDVDMAAKARNGWTEQDEQHFRTQAQKLGMLIYKPGHNPDET